MERTSRIYFLALTVSFITVNTAASRHPPEITKFIQKDLVNPNDVEFGTFKLPCEASGTNLSWTWKHNDKVITLFSGIPYSLGEDGTLIGKYLSVEHSGTYQCIVKDKDSKIEVFSRKLKVAITVVGDFIDRGTKTAKVDLGQPFRFQCPKHTAGFGNTYIWAEPSTNIHLSRNVRRGISPDGTLFIAYVTQKDIDEINYRGIRCQIRAGHSLDYSGTLFLEKKNPQQTATNVSPSYPDPNVPFSLSWAAVPAGDELAIEGRRKSLYCFANGRPAPDITWKKNGKRIVHGQNSFEIPGHYWGRRLIITNVDKESHQDVYSCEANNSLSNGQSLIRTINLVVKVPPRWTDVPPPSETSVIIGRNDTIECKVTAEPIATISWYKNGIQLQSSSDRIIVDGSKLHLRHVNLTDDGVYQCAAENRYGMIVSATWVQVKAWKPFFADGQFGPFRLLHGSEGRLQCKPSAEPRPRIQWFINGALISYRANSRYRLLLDGTLVIKNVDKDKDSVNYTCEAVNMMGHASATKVPIVLVQPSFVTKPGNQTVLEKGTTTFYCNAIGNPLPNITWVKDGRTVGIGNTLRFKTTWRYQSGRYWCFAQNGLNVTIKASAVLNVQFPPIFKSRPADQTVDEGEEATFHCSATGNPNPKITWLKDGKTVTTENTLSFVAFKNISGKYWCSANNGLGLAINTSAHLIVQIEPHLITKPRDQTVVEYKPVSFQCTATGHPTPVITWTKDGKIVGTGSQLTFVALRSHAGRYWCSANNGVSAGVRASAYLRVLYVPSPPSNVTITGCNDWTAEVYWIPGPSIDDAPITHYLIEQESSGNPVVFRLLYNVSKPDATSASLNLSRGTVLRFRLRAVNSVGASRPSSTVETVCKSTETEIGARQVTETPIYHKAWFLTILALVAYVLLISMFAHVYKSYYKGKGKKYEVGKRERKRGYKDEGKQSEESVDEDETNDLVVDLEKKPPEKNQHRHSRPVSNSISLFEMQFREDGSFTEEYAGEDELLQGTFV